MEGIFPEYLQEAVNFRKHTPFPWSDQIIKSPECFGLPKIIYFMLNASTVEKNFIHYIL